MAGTKAKKTAKTAKMGADELEASIRRFSYEVILSDNYYQVYARRNPISMDKAFNVYTRHVKCHSKTIEAMDRAIFI